MSVIGVDCFTFDCDGCATQFIIISMSVTQVEIWTLFDSAFAV